LLIDTTATAHLPGPQNPGECHLYLAEGCRLYIAPTGVPERRRIWRLALPISAPVGAEVDLEALAQLDMTGAAIVSSARTAALLAADAGSQAITMAHMVRATARQYRREARVLTPSELGSHGVLLQGAS
jgi:hypothetical protein